MLLSNLCQGRSLIPAMEHISGQQKSKLSLTAMSLSMPIMETTFVTGDYASEEKHGKHGPCILGS